MKSYPHIPGPRNAPLGNPCLAFYKYDGSNLRFEWSRKRGWYKFGTRRRLFDHTDSMFGIAIKLFHNKYADDLEKIIKSNKIKTNIQSVIAFCEFFGEHSFAGQHKYKEPKELVLIDVVINGEEFLSARDFVNYFGKLQIPDVVYEGNFNKQFIKDVVNGKYPVNEGVVAKGILKGKKKKIWMAKVKTTDWLYRLRKKSQIDASLRQQLKQDLKEQYV